MDFANRGTRPANTETVSVNNGAAGQTHKSKKSNMAPTRIMSIVLLFSGTLLVVGLILMLVFGTKNTDESKYLNKDKYQAVFLNGGQVYFGKVGDFNSKFMTLTDIYYLRVNQQVQPGSTQSTSNDVSLAKLGNELHGPEDRMVLNRSEVQFWENLKDDGQVVKAITEYKKNPNAANATPTNATTQSTGNQQQTNTTPTTTTPTTTKKP